VFWNRGRPPAELQAAFDDAYRRITPQLANEPSPAETYERPDADIRAAESAFTADGRFTGVEIRDFAHTRRYTRDEWLDQLPTHSDHRTLPPAQLAAVIEAIGTAIDVFGGGFEMRYRTWLLTARRRGARRP
jgi:hypothetical protein